MTVTTSAPNDLATGQTVTIAGISGSGVTGFNGDFTITVVNSTTFTYSATTTGTATITGATAQGTVHAVVGHGQQSTTGQMTLSSNGQYLFLNGYDQNPNPADPGYATLQSVSSVNVPRSIARIGADGSVVTEAFLAGSGNVLTGGIINGVASPDGTQFYLSGFNGIDYFSTLTQSATLQGSRQQSDLQLSAIHRHQVHGERP